MTATGMTPRITLHELTLGYEGRVALQDVSLTIEPGALLAVNYEIGRASCRERV